MRDRQPPELQIGEQGLNVAHNGPAGGRIADVADRPITGKAIDDIFRIEIVTDQSEGAVSMEMEAEIRALGPLELQR